MSRARDIDTGLNDKKRKRMKMSEEDKAKDVSKGGNAKLSSTPSHTVHPPAGLAPGEESKSGDFLFAMELYIDDIALLRTLFLSYELASRCLPPLVIPGRVSMAKIKISDSQNHSWDATLMHSQVHCDFMITGSWGEGYVANHNLEARDLIHFYRPVPHTGNNHYLIKHVKREELATNNGKFNRENFLFQLQLTSTDVTCGGLIIPKDKIIVHFRAIKTGDEALKLKWLHFTDAEGNESWRMLSKFDNDSDGYMILNGLEKFLRRYKLKAMDLIKLYKPVKPLNADHFIIDYEKREAANEKPATERGTDNYPGNGSGGVD